MAPIAKQDIKAKLTTALKLFASAGLIYWMIRKGALDLDTFRMLATPAFLSFAAASIFGQIFFNNYRWLVLMRGQGFSTSVRHTLPLSLIGIFFNFAMPGGVGGDVVKGYYLLQDYPRQKFAAAVSIFVDRMMGFFIMVATAFLALVINWDAVATRAPLVSIAIGVTAFFIGFLGFFFLSLSKLLQNSPLGRLLFEKIPGGSHLRQLYETLHSYRRSPMALVAAAILSFINQILMVAFTYVVGRMLGITEIPLAAYFFLVPVGSVVQALPVSPAGIGIGQAAAFFLFNTYLGRESQLGPTAVTAMQLTSLFWGLFGAYFYVRRGRVALHPGTLPERS